MKGETYKVEDIAASFQKSVVEVLVDNGIKAFEAIEEARKLDMDVIVYAIKELKAYKGLTLIEVKANDGTYVLIKV